MTIQEETKNVFEDSNVILESQSNSNNLKHKLKYEPEHPVIGTILCLLITAFMVWIFRYIILLPVCAECQVEGRNWVEEKLYEMMHLFFDLHLGKEFFAILGVLFLVGVSGFFAGLMDDALCMLPFGRLIRNKIDFKLPFILRATPAIILAVYVLASVVVHIFNENIQFEIQKFSLLGKGYTAGMWVSQIAYGLIIVALIALIIEAFMSSGVLGLIIRVPLLILSNMALSVVAVMFSLLGSLVFLVVMAVVITLSIVGKIFSYKVRTEEKVIYYDSYKY